MSPGMILVQRLRGVDDPRVTGRCDHALVDILVIALCAIMAGAEGWDDMEAWGEANEERLRLYLELNNGIPGHDTPVGRAKSPTPGRVKIPHLLTA